MADPAQGVMDAVKNANPIGAVQTAANNVIDRAKQIVEPSSPDEPAVLTPHPTPSERFMSQAQATDDQATIRNYYLQHPEMAAQDPLTAKRLGVATHPTNGAPTGPGQGGIPTAEQEALQNPNLIGEGSSKVAQAVGASPETAGKIGTGVSIAAGVGALLYGSPFMASARSYLFPETVEQLAIKAMQPEEAATAARSVTPETMYTTGTEAPGKDVTPMTGDQLKSDTLPTAEHLEALKDNPAVTTAAKQSAAEMEPALKDTETGKAYDSGKNHGEVFDKLPEDIQNKDLESGFLDGNRFISREEALDRVAKMQDATAGAPPAAEPQPESVGAAKLTSKRDMAEDLSVAHTMPDMIARAQETPLSKDEFYGFKVGRDVDEGHYTLQDPINMIDALRISHYTGQAVGGMIDAAKSAQSAIAAGAENPLLTKTAAEAAAEIRDEVLPRWSGMRHQIGLALRVLGNPTSDMRNLLLNTRDLLSEVDFSQPGQLMHALANLSPEEQTKMLAKVAQPGFMDHLATMVQAGLLGPNTAVKKTGSDAFMLLWQAAERTVGSVVSQIPGIGSGEMSPREAMAWMRGVAENFGTAREIAAASERADRPLWDQQLGFGEAAHKMLGSQGTSIEGTWLGNAYDLYANMIHELGGRRILYPDQMAKYLHYQGSIAAQSMRQAIADASDEEGAVGRLFDKYRANPTEAMQNQAYNDARAGTFARSVQSTAFMNQLRSHWYGKLMFPFWQTVVNIASKGMQYTGLGPLSSEWRSDFMAGGAQRDLAIARQSLGMGVAALIAHHYAAGNIEGPRPANPDLNKLWAEQGHQPYSIKLANGTFDLGNLYEPIGDMVGMVVDTAAIAQQISQSDDVDTANKWQRLENIGTALTLAIGNQVHNMSFFRTASDLLNAFSNSASPADRMRFLKDSTSEFVPTAARDVARTVDPVSREIRGMIDQLKSEIPGYSKTLPPDIDLFGDPAMHPLGSAGVSLDLLSTPKLTDVKNDPIRDELFRLYRDDPRAIPAAPRAIKGSAQGAMGTVTPKTGVMLTAAEQHEWKVLRGKMPDDDGNDMRGGLSDMMHSDDYKDANDYERKEMIDKFLTMRGGMATEYMLEKSEGQTGGLSNRVEQNYNRREQMMGTP